MSTGNSKENNMNNIIERPADYITAKGSVGKLKRKNEVILGQALTGERALFQGEQLSIMSCRFEEGESPLKEASGLDISDTEFHWKYPLWYCQNVRLKNCTLYEMARAGIWYTSKLTVEDTKVIAPKNFRRCDGMTLINVEFTNAEETLWHCKNANLTNVKAVGDYFAMNCENMRIDGLELDGNYSFDGAKNIEIHNSRLMSKDSFWNSENIRVYDSYISGEYLGWNSRNLTLINCTIESLQGMCYIENLVMKNCRLENTTLAFEYSSCNVEVVNKVDSILNPKSGKIRVAEVGEVILEEDKIDPSQTEIIIG